MDQRQVNRRPGFWLWIILASLLTIYIAPAYCMFALLISAASAPRNEHEMNCLTGAVVGIPIGLCFGLVLLIAGIVLHRAKDQDARRNNWLFSLIWSVPYLLLTTQAIIHDVTYEPGVMIVTTIIHHGLIILLLVMLYRASRRIPILSSQKGSVD